MDLLKKYWLGLPIINIALALLFHIDYFLYQMTEQPYGRHAPISYFSLLFMVLMGGGYVLLGAVMGFKLGKRHVTSVWKISLCSGITFMITLFALSLQYYGLSYSLNKDIYLFAGEQAFGFFIGAICGCLWKKYRRPSLNVKQ